MRFTLETSLNAQMLVCQSACTRYVLVRDDQEPKETRKSTARLLRILKNINITDLSPGLEEVLIASVNTQRNNWFALGTVLHRYAVLRADGRKLMRWKDKGTEKKPGNVKFMPSRSHQFCASADNYSLSVGGPESPPALQVVICLCLC